VVGGETEIAALEINGHRRCGTEFVGDLLRAAGVEPGERTVPRWLARTIAAATSFLAHPPLTRTAIALMSHEVTVDDTRARREIGYQGKKSIADGLAEIKA
jgi:hypothetical protein